MVLTNFGNEKALFASQNLKAMTTDLAFAQNVQIGGVEKWS